MFKVIVLLLILVLIIVKILLTERYENFVDDRNIKELMLLANKN